MPAHKLRPQKLQCPFCSAISMRGTGLSAHVRAQHPREYGKWNKNPNRLLEAARAASPQPAANTDRRLHAVRSPAPVELRKAAVSVQPAEERPTLLGTPARQAGENISMTSTFSCPVMGCGKISPRSQGLSAHVRNAHPEHWKKYGTKPPAKPETSTPSVQTTAPTPTSPLEYLDIAITGLKSRRESVRADIQRLTALEAEDADITRQLEALTQARAAFVPAETTASTDTGGGPVQVANATGTGKKKTMTATN
jgi:hypothetical protein